MESVFFIDTGGKDDTEDARSEDGVDDLSDDKEEVQEDKVMGAKDAAVEAKLRNRATKERSLASFLFGKPKDTSDAESEHSEDDSDSEKLDPDEEDEEPDTEDEDAAGEGGGDGDKSEDASDGDGDDEVTLSSVQPTLPGDFLLGNKRKRKAAWEDEDDSKVLVKDVTATYKKAVGKHGQQVRQLSKFGWKTYFS